MGASWDPVLRTKRKTAGILLNVTLQKLMVSQASHWPKPEGQLAEGGGGGGGFL